MTDVDPGVRSASMFTLGSDGDARVGWLVRLRVRSEMLDQFQLLTAQMVVVAAAEPGTLVYERFITPDRLFVCGYELYASSSDAIRHLDTFRARFAEQFIQCVERDSFEVHGRPNSELRRLLDSLGARYLTSLVTLTPHD